MLNSPVHIFPLSYCKKQGDLRSFFDLTTTKYTACTGVFLFCRDEGKGQN